MCGVCVDLSFKVYLIDKCFTEGRGMILILYQEMFGTDINRMKVHWLPKMLWTIWTMISSCFIFQ